MKLTKTHRLILYALGQFYLQLNQPLKEKPLQLRTSKIAFITFLLHSGIITKQERALYKNLEMLEQKRLITYENRMIRFTNAGIFILKKIDKEIEEFLKIKQFFSEKLSLKKEFQTVMELRKR